MVARVLTGRVMRKIHRKLPFVMAIILIMPLVLSLKVKAEGVYKSLSELDGKRIGIQTGTQYDRIVTKSLPNVTLSYYNTNPDLAAALVSNKIDAFPGDEPVLQMMAEEDDRLYVLSEYMDSSDFGYMFPKTSEGNALLEEFDEWLSGMISSGELDRLKDKWAHGTEEEKTMDSYDDLPAVNGTLTYATEAAYPPLNYYRGDSVVGLELELTSLFCRDRGYGLFVEVINLDGILPAVQTGKVDFAASGLSITEERKESVNFSIPYYSSGTVMAVLKEGAVVSTDNPADPSKTAAEGQGAWASVKSSFEKTFIREHRYALFLEGIGTTMAITILSIIFGTALGFGVFMLCRNGNAIANTVTGICVWLVQGTPMVVLLMILYYIVFSSTSISGIAVAVIGFTLTFAAAVYGMLKMGVGAVDNGQYEAAYALGHTNIHTFFRIILPQALPHAMPAYKAEIVGLIKATAIVGYVAVQDLTKMGDIVRSRTYEAFFPLIAVTVIYFVLEGLLGFLVSRINVCIDPRKRKRENVLKGVNIHD